MVVIMTAGALSTIFMRKTITEKVELFKLQSFPVYSLFQLLLQPS